LTFKKLDWLIIFVTSFLVLIGLLSIYSSSKGDFFNFKKQIFFFAVGFFLMMLIPFFDLRPLREGPYLILSLYLLCLISLALLFFIAPDIRGVKSWYKIGPMSLDPTEFTKIVLLLLLAKYFSMRHLEMYRIFHIFISGVYVLLPSILIFFQPDLGSVLIILGLWLGVLIISGIKVRHFFLLLFLFVLLFIFGWNSLLKDYQKERILSFLFSEFKDPLGINWNQTQSIIALGSGGFLGKGFQKGSQVQLGFLPEPHTDFIFAAIGEEMGFVGISLLFILFFVLIWRIFKIAFKTRSNFGKIFCLGYIFLIFSQIFVHVAVNIGLIPVIGITLPFVSYGGSSLIALFIGIGIIQSIRVYKV